MKYVIMAIGYFANWVEAKPLSTITEAKTFEFIWKSIICHFGIPRIIIIDNGRQFDNEKYKKMCYELGIYNYFSSPLYPQANCQVEAINNTIKNNLKTKISHLKGAWVEELPYSLSFGVEVVIPVEIGAPSYRTPHFLRDDNEIDLRVELDFLKEL